MISHHDLINRSIKYGASQSPTATGLEHTTVPIRQSVFQGPLSWSIVAAASETLCFPVQYARMRNPAASPPPSFPHQSPWHACSPLLHPLTPEAVVANLKDTL